MLVTMDFTIISTQLHTVEHLLSCHINLTMLSPNFSKVQSSPSCQIHGSFQTLYWFFFGEGGSFQTL